MSKRPRTMPLPWPSLGRRAGAMAWGYASFDDGSAPSSTCAKQAAKQNETGKNKTRHKKRPKHPCRLASRERASEEYQENPKNARGPEWHPDKTPEGKDARPKRVNRQKRRGTKTRKRKKTQGACGGVPCDYLSCLSSKKKGEERRRRRRENQGRRTTTQKHQT